MLVNRYRIQFATPRGPRVRYTTAANTSDLLRYIADVYPDWPVVWVDVIERAIPVIAEVTA